MMTGTISLVAAPDAQETGADCPVHDSQRAFYRRVASG
jgi:hypothetical protein